MIHICRVYDFDRFLSFIIALENCQIFPFSYSVLLRCVSACKIPSNSFLSEIGCKFIQEVLLSSVRPKASDMSTCCFFDFIFKCLKVFEHFILLSHGVDLGLHGEVIDERHIISASVKCSHLSWSPYVKVDSFTHIPLFQE